MVMHTTGSLPKPKRFDGSELGFKFKNLSTSKGHLWVTCQLHHSRIMAAGHLFSVAFWQLCFRTGSFFHWELGNGIIQ